MQLQVGQGGGGPPPEPTSRCTPLKGPFKPPHNNTPCVQHLGFAVSLQRIRILRGCEARCSRGCEARCSRGCEARCSRGHVVRSSTARGVTHVRAEVVGDNEYNMHVRPGKLL